MKSYQDAVNLHLSTGCEGIMVARGILTNPTLFMEINTEHTSIDCVQKWLNICFNTILSEYNKDSDIDLSFIKNICSNKKFPNLTYQCFHHHLVFMLEKVLPKCERKVFNSLNNFYDVFEFLYKKYNILPEQYDYDQYILNQNISLNYENGDEIYLKLLKDFNLKN